MPEKNNAARRRRAFADFKESQYDDSFSLNTAQKRKKRAKKLFKWVFIILAALVFIAVGFILTDALLNVSQQPYVDEQSYSASFTTTSTTQSTSQTEQEDQTDTQEEDSSNQTDDTLEQ